VINGYCLPAALAPEINYDPITAVGKIIYDDPSIFIRRSGKYLFIISIEYPYGRIGDIRAGSPLQKGDLEIVGQRSAAHQEQQ